MMFTAYYTYNRWLTFFDVTIITYFIKISECTLHDETSISYRIYNCQWTLYAATLVTYCIVIMIWSVKIIQFARLVWAYCPYHLCRRSITVHALVQSDSLVATFFSNFAAIPQFEASLKILGCTEQSLLRWSHSDLHFRSLVLAPLKQLQRLLRCLTSARISPHDDLQTYSVERLPHWHWANALIQLQLVYSRSREPLHKDHTPFKQNFSFRTVLTLNIERTNKNMHTARQKLSSALTKPCAQSRWTSPTSCWFTTTATALAEGCRWTPTTTCQQSQQTTSTSLAAISLWFIK